MVWIRVQMARHGLTLTDLQAAGCFAIVAPLPAALEPTRTYRNAEGRNGTGRARCRPGCSGPSTRDSRWNISGWWDDVTRPTGPRGRRGPGPTALALQAELAVTTLYRQIRRPFEACASPTHWNGTRIFPRTPGSTPVYDRKERRPFFSLS